MQTVYLKEPLQSIDIEWGVAFIGSRWGNIFTYNIAVSFQDYLWFFLVVNNFIYCVK